MSGVVWRPGWGEGGGQVGGRAAGGGLAGPLCLPCRGNKAGFQYVAYAMEGVVSILPRFASVCFRPGLA